MDNLVLSPGLDIDNLEVQIEANLNSFESKIQKLRKTPLDYLIVKSYFPEGAEKEGLFTDSFYKIHST